MTSITLPTEPRLCIYHKNCFDGMASAMVVKEKYPEIELYPMGYGDPIPPFVRDCGSLILVDFTFKRDVIEVMASLMSILIIDHHKTAEADLADLPYAIFDMSESGATLTWKTLFPERQVPWFLRYIKDNDLWEYKLWESESINAYIQSFPIELKAYQKMLYLFELDKDRQKIALEGKSIVRYKESAVGAMCDYAAGTDGWPFYDSSIPIANATVLFSMVGQELCKRYPKAPFAAYYFDRLSDGIRQWGLRSIGDFDVSEVAKKLGGGGHKNAAGFQHALMKDKE